MSAQLKLVEPDLSSRALAAVLIARIKNGEFLHPISMAKRQVERELRAAGFSRKQVKTVISVVSSALIDGIPDV